MNSNANYLNKSSDLLKRKILKFYRDDPTNIEKMADIVNKNTIYSLRILEWFCNNYSKKKNIIYTILGKTDFNVYLSYKAHLDSYQKKKFDPFKRDHQGYAKFNIYYDNKGQVWDDPSLVKTKKVSVIETTVGQLNFLKWCIENNILEYVKKNINAIKLDMNNSINYTNSKTTAGEKKERKKRQSLSVSATRTCIKRFTSVNMTFK